MSFSSDDRQVEPLAQLVGERHALEPGDVLGEADDAVRALDDPGHADHDAVDQAPLEARRLDERRRRAPRSPPSAAAAPPLGELDVLARANAAAEVADRPAQEAGAEVEAEHERRLGNRLEEHGAVARALRPVAQPRARGPTSTSDCSASETVGFEMPARREISAREIGAPARIVSSTVRSFRCLRRGGVARVCSLTMVNNPNQACGKRPDA